MAGPYEVESLEEAPEALRAFYVEDTTEEGETVFRLNAEGIAKKLVNFDKVIGEKKTISGKFQTIKEALGDRDPQELLTRLEELEKKEKEATKDSATKKGDFDKLKKELESELEKERVTMEKEKAELNDALKSALIDTQATMEIAKHGGKVKALLPHVRSAVKVTRLENGQRVVRVLDPESEEEGAYRSYFKTGEPMGIAHLIEEMMEDDDFSPLFEADGRAGSGAPPKSGSGGANAIKSIAGKQMISRDDAKDVQKYRAAKAQADKAGLDLEIAPE